MTVVSPLSHGLLCVSELTGESGRLNHLVSKGDKISPPFIWSNRSAFLWDE